jgi:hypothetical protein
MTILKDLLPLSRYQESRADFFPSLESARWAVRQQRPALVEAGALVKIADRLFVDPTRADRVFVDAGKESAARSAGLDDGIDNKAR